jgi:uncharacterized membrane protein
MNPCSHAVIGREAARDTSRGIEMDTSTRPAGSAFGLRLVRTDNALWTSAKVAPSHAAFALVMIGLGIVGLIHGDFALVWQRIPIEHLPGQTLIAYACAALELLTGIGLLVRRTARLSSGILVVYLLLWLVLLKLPAVVVAPQMEAVWLGFGEIAVILAGGWILFAAHAGTWEKNHLGFAVGARALRNARLLFALSLPMIGLSHFAYVEQTASFVPAWLPSHVAWAYLTGAGSIAASAGILFGIWPRLAAALEAAMLGIITVLVWAPGIGAGPIDRLHVTGFLISSAIACGAWVVADSYRTQAWLALGWPWRKTDPA